MSGQSTLIASAMLALSCGCGPQNTMGGGSPIPAMTQAAQVPVSQASRRAMRVAATSACAQLYGYAHDPLKLRTAYLDYEARAGATRAQMVDIQESYDASMAEARNGKESSCSGRDSDEVRAELRRYQAGSFIERAGPPKSGFDEKTFWDNADCGGRC